MTKLTRLAVAVDRVNDLAGRGVSWLVIALVILQFAIVIARYVFAIGSPAAQEAVWYMYGLVFMIGAGHVLLHDGHVRLDLFYRGAGRRTQALVDLGGASVLLVPLCVAIVVYATPYVARSWLVFEGSNEPGGLPLVFLYKTVLPVFAVLLGAQGASMAIRAGLFLSGRVPDYGARDGAPRRAAGA